VKHFFFPKKAALSRAQETYEFPCVGKRKRTQRKRTRGFLKKKTCAQLAMKASSGSVDGKEKEKQLRLAHQLSESLRQNLFLFL
jgi:hypothetical protein